ERTGQHYWDAELYRLKGTLTLQSETGPGRSPGRRRGRAEETEAESCFLRAIEIARRQGAKSLELRAATSLSQLWARRGRATEGRALLSDVFHWFTEGFDTADLSRARLLLGELGRRANDPSL